MPGADSQDADAARSLPHPRLAVTPAKAAFPASGGRLDLLVEIEVDLPAAHVDRKPLALALVIDRSGSMGGEPLEAAKRAAQTAVEMTLPGDRVAVVAFDSNVEVPVALASVTDYRAGILAAIARLQPGGSTDLFGGWAEGLSQVLACPDPDIVGRVVVLSDGQANVGVTDPNAIASDARQATVHGVTTTAMGLGRHYDEALLRLLADAGQGNYVFLEDHRAVVDAFEQELAGLSALRGRRVRLDAGSIPGATLRQFHGAGRPAAGGVGNGVGNGMGIGLGSDDDGLILGDLLAGMPTEHLVQLELAPGTAAVTLQLTWDDALTGHRGRESVELVLPSVDDETFAALGVDDKVGAARTAAELAEVKARLSAAARSGDAAAARRRLDEIAAKVPLIVNPATRADETAQFDRLRGMVEQLDFALAARTSEKFARDRVRGVSDLKRRQMSEREAEVRAQKLAAAKAKESMGTAAHAPASPPRRQRWQHAQGDVLFEQPLRRPDGRDAAWQLVLGDITEQAVDAIVNSTNRGMFGASGVDGAIARRGGPELQAAMRAIGSVEHGRAVFTPGYGLPARFVVHTATPAWGSTGRELEYLAMCYESTLALADQLGARTIALPAIGTGHYRYPAAPAAQTAVAAARTWLGAKGSFELVRFVVFDRSTARAYLALLSGPALAQAPA